MSEKDASVDELRARAIIGVESYKTGYRHGLQESEQEVGLLKLTVEQLRSRLANADRHIEMLETTVLRIDRKVEYPPGATVVYSHSEDPGGVKYRQYASDPLPSWAVNVRLEAAG